MKSVADFFCSLRLTVVLLALGIVLVFIGTVAQADEGLYVAQARYFKHWFVPWFSFFGHKIPVPLPGGYLIGTLLLMNLVAAHIRRFQWGWKKLGIHLTHAGVVLLLAGQLMTDMFSEETHMRFTEGEAKNYSESGMVNELVFTTDAGTNDETVVSIPESLLARGGEIRHEKLPFALRVQSYHINARFRDRAPMVDTNAPPATQGVGPRITFEPVAEAKSMDDRNFPAVILELARGAESMGTWFVSPLLRDAQEIAAGSARWRVSFRWARAYHPFSLTLLKTTHEVYPGTEIPKNFQSRVRIENPATGEQREVDIRMNEPLRYGGLTFFQFQMGKEDLERDARGTSTLQVVRNPAWLTPYAGCAIVSAGMLWQFLYHLAGFASRRRKE